MIDFAEQLQRIQTLAATPLQDIARLREAILAMANTPIGESRMTALLIRGLSDETLQNINIHAANTGASREEWIRDQLTLLAAEPCAYNRYTIRFSGNNGETGILERNPDRRPDAAVLGSFDGLMSSDQMEVYQTARHIMTQGKPGARGRAMEVLATQFAHVTCR